MGVKGEGKCVKFRLLERKKKKGAQKDAIRSQLHLIRRRGTSGASGPVSKAIRKTPELCQPPNDPASFQWVE